MRMWYVGDPGDEEVRFDILVKDELAVPDIYPETSPAPRGGVCRGSLRTTFEIHLCITNHLNAAAAIRPVGDPNRRPVLTAIRQLQPGICRFYIALLRAPATVPRIEPTGQI